MDQFSADLFTYRSWPDDCTGLSEHRIVEVESKAGIFSSTITKKERIYRFSERPVGRDAATRFYDNPYMQMVGVQRVAVVDEDAGEVMICTPARAAAWMVLRNRGNQNAVVGEMNQLDNISQTELDEVLSELHCHANSHIWTDSEDNNDIPTKLVIKEGDTLGDGNVREWTLEGFADNGGWAKYFGEVMPEGKRWLAVIKGQTSSKRIQSEPGKFDLVFKDNESELLYGEGRCFRSDHEEILGVQFRRGFSVIRLGKSKSGPHPAEMKRYDQFILPKGLTAGVYSQKTRELKAGLTWRIRPDEALTHYTLGDDNMQVFPGN